MSRGPVGQRDTQDDSIGSRLAALKRATRAQLPGLSCVKSDEDHLRAAIEWLHRSQDAINSAGSAASYNLILGWEDAYPETTGYIIPTLYRYADLEDDRKPFDRATAMAEWLLSIQQEGGSFPGGTGVDGDPNAFNTGQIVFGLTEAYRRTDDDRYRRAAERACEWLVDTQAKDGPWRKHDYKGLAHSYSARIGWGLLLGAAVSDERGERYERSARRLFGWVVDNQLENGWFEKAAFEHNGDPFLHTIAYTVRGLLEGSRLLNDDTLFAAAKTSADALLRLQTTQGTLRGAYDAEWNPAWYYCPTGNAQMALVWLRLSEITGEWRYLAAARHAIQFLKRHQPLDGPPAVRGGVPGSYPFVGRYLYLRYPNWAAKFFADTLLLSREQAREESAEPVKGTEPSVCRVCLLCDGNSVERWVAEAIEEMLSRTEAEISLVVINEDSGVLSSGNLKRGVRYPSYAALWIGANLVARRSDGHDYDDQILLTELPEVKDAEWIRTYPANVDGLWSELPAEVVTEIASKTDLVFRRGFGLLRGEILTATRYGVLSYHHGDPRAYRGGPAGFWEYMNGEDWAGMMVQSLEAELDAGIVQAMDHVDIGDCDSWGEIRERLYTGSTHLLADAVERVCAPDQDPYRIEELGPVYHPPSAADIARFGMKRLRSIGREG